MLIDRLHKIPKAVGAVDSCIVHAFLNFCVVKTIDDSGDIDYAIYESTAVPLLKVFGITYMKWKHCWYNADEAYLSNKEDAITALNKIIEAQKLRNKTRDEFKNECIGNPWDKPQN